MKNWIEIIGKDDFSLVNINDLSYIEISLPDEINFYTYNGTVFTSNFRDKENTIKCYNKIKKMLCSDD